MDAVNFGCSRCKEDKPASSFYRKSNLRGVSHHCKACELEIKKVYYVENREKLIAKACAHAKKIGPRYAEYHYQYYRKNKEKARTHARNWMRKRLQEPGFKLMHGLRDRVRKAIKNRYPKAANTALLIGCSMEHLRGHLESLFLPGMTWENYGRHGWHIDHIRPCASFDFLDPEQQRQCFHWTNLQPLWWLDNVRKSDKWTPKT